MSNTTSTRPLNVLYIQHVGVNGGATRSMLLLVDHLARTAVVPFLIVPRGPIVEHLVQHGYRFIAVRGVSQFDNSLLSAYRGVRWLVLLRELGLLPGTVLALFRARRIWNQVDVIHVNDWSMLPTALLAKLVIGRPIVLHIRTMQSTKSTLRRKWLLWSAQRYVDQIIAIDSAVASSIAPVPSLVIHNGAEMPSREQPCERERDGVLRIGIVANFLRNKGVEDFVEAANICIGDFGLRDVVFHFFGDSQQKTRGLYAGALKKLGMRHDVKADVLMKVREYGISSQVTFEGYVSSPERIYRSIDVLCFPSRLDAVGRPVFEAAAFGRPSIVALKTRRTDDAIVDGLTGFVVPEGDTMALAHAIRRFYEERVLVSRMGAAAFEHARVRHDIERVAERMRKVYETLGCITQIK